MNVRLTPNLSLTNVHPLARNGQPVLVVGAKFRLAEERPDSFGSSDIIEIYNRTAPAAYWACFSCGNLGGGEREAVAACLRRRREGPQLEAQ